jgi:hypothetical protein
VRHRERAKVKEDGLTMAAKKKKKKKKKRRGAPRGFALLSAEERSELGRRGAEAVHAAGKAYRWNSSTARRAVKKSWRNGGRPKPEDEGGDK